MTKTATKSRQVHYTTLDGMEHVFRWDGDFNEIRPEIERRCGVNGWTSSGSGPWTEPLFNCWICGNPELGNWMETAKQELVNRGLCHHCNFWVNTFLEYLGAKRPIVAIVNARYYVIDREDARGPAHCRGFGGSRFDIRFKDGRQVVSTNLWDRGTIPLNWRGVLPDNAIFSKEPA